MHTIKPKPKPTKKRRYENKHAKLIHLNKKTSILLDTCAKLKNISLKEYIEQLCDKQAFFEAQLFIKQSKKIQNNKKPLN